MIVDSGNKPLYQLKTKGRDIVIQLKNSEIDIEAILAHVTESLKAHSAGTPDEAPEEVQQQG